MRLNPAPHRQTTHETLRPRKPRPDRGKPGALCPVRNPLQIADLGGGLIHRGLDPFFYADWAIPATWLFLIGSIFFALKPTLRLIREFRLYRMGQLDDPPANGRNLGYGHEIHRAMPEGNAPTSPGGNAGRPTFPGEGASRPPRGSALPSALMPQPQDAVGRGSSRHAPQWQGEPRPTNGTTR
ncbi:MAG: YrhK family protein [Defluviimonas denitrificans]